MYADMGMGQILMHSANTISEMIRLLGLTGMLNGRKPPQTACPHDLLGTVATCNHIVVAWVYHAIPHNRLKDNLQLSSILRSM
jgi:hypothetical protein